jgi:hypothetical protein
MCSVPLTAPAARLPMFGLAVNVDPSVENVVCDWRLGLMALMRGQNDPFARCVELLF